MNIQSRLNKLIFSALLGIATSSVPAPSWGKALGYLEVPPLQLPSITNPNSRTQDLPPLARYTGFYYDFVISGTTLDLLWEGNRNFRMTIRLGVPAGPATAFVIGLTCDETDTCRPNEVYPTPPRLCSSLYLRLLPGRGITLVDPCGWGAIPLR